MTTDRWSDDSFLDRLMGQADSEADAAVAALIRLHGTAGVGKSFALLKNNNDPLPPNAPAALHIFMAETAGLPPGTDKQRVARGGAIFTEYFLESAITLMASSLPSGYSAPRLSEVLAISDDLGRAAYQRALGVAQMLIHVGCQTACAQHGHAMILAQKMRLLHAGVRHIVDSAIPDFRTRLGGVPVSHEDMLGTLMGFSLLVIDGLEQLQLGLEPEEAEDIYYLWRTFGEMLGLQGPPTADGSPPESYVPPDLAAARVFYDAYARRHYVPAAENPHGVYLAEADQRLMIQLIPRLLRWGVAPKVPLVLTEDLLGMAGMRRVGLEPVGFGHRPAEWLLKLLTWVDHEMFTPAKSAHGRFAALMFQGMIDRSFGGEITFAVPIDRDDLIALVQEKPPPPTGHYIGTGAAARSPSSPVAVATTDDSTRRR